MKTDAISAAFAAYEKALAASNPPPELALVEIESAQPLVVEMERSACGGSIDPAVILAREPQIAGIRRHRQTHPTAAEDARSRWEAEQKRRFGCNYQDVDGVGVCLTHGVEPMSFRSRGS